MRAFQVSLNGKRICVAGVGDDGVLAAIVNWVTRKGEGDLFLSVGGLLSPVDEHVEWVRKHDLSVGDEIKVKIVETSSAESPIKRYRADLAEDLKHQKSYVRAMAKKLGWKIQARSKRTTS